MNPQNRMNPRTRRAALYAIGFIAALASVDALAHSYTGLYSWALHHRLGGWQAMSWPAEIDVFLVAGELALYVAYLDSWPTRQRLWPWVTALAGLAVSVAGNVGHVQPLPGVAVTVADRLTAAASPIAAFAGLMIGLLVLKMMRQASGTADSPRGLTVAERHGELEGQPSPAVGDAGGTPYALSLSPSYRDDRLLADAVRIVRDTAASGQTVSRRELATRLRERGHHFSNAQLRDIASAVSLIIERAA